MGTAGHGTAASWQAAGAAKVSTGGGLSMHPMTMQTSKRLEIHDLTDQVGALVRASGVASGLVTVSTLHTTTAVFVNEPQTALLDDIEEMLERLVPRGEEWKHNDPRFSDCDRQNADSHLRAIMLGNSVTLQITDGGLLLGEWQRILFVELDGPRKRNLSIQILAA